MELPDIEDVAEQVHSFWVAQKIQQGKTNHAGQSGEELMVPYHLLTEAAKELDRATVRSVYGAVVVAANAAKLRKP